MIQSKLNLRVRYSETDQMGFVYHAHYAQYFEVGRVETLRKAGYSYKKLEEKGFYLPVHTLNIKYIKAAQYDDELTVVTTMDQMPSNRICFHYNILRNEELLVEGDTSLIFMNSEYRACRPPQWFLDHLKPFFKS
tara:strand:+ start:273 stop:677 length:405 start_codon:yes stop_codon:yes gene_type:complete